MAVDRFASSGAPYGMAPFEAASRRIAVAGIAAVEGAIGRLRLPDELHEFWARWDVSQFGQAPFDRFLSPVEALDRWQQQVDLGCPRILLPIADMESMLIAIELESANHFGSRVFQGSASDHEYSLWTIGISGLLDLLSDTLDRGGIMGRDGRAVLDPAAVRRTARAAQLSGTFPLAGDYVELGDRDGWPSHWLQVEWEASPRPVLRGATHTVAEFDVARELGELAATLSGEFELLASPIGFGGSVGQFVDSTGSIQVFVSEPVARQCAWIGSGRCEIDVVGVPELAQLHIDLHQLAGIDTSVTVVAIRPLG